MPCRVHAPTKYPHNPYARIRGSKIDGVGLALDAPQAWARKSIVCSETGVFRGDGDFCIKRFEVVFSLRHTEVLGAVKVNVDQISFRVIAELNPAHAAIPCAGQPVWPVP